MKKYSIAQYGSSLRDDYDKYSDKDLLIVADSYSILNRLRRKYEKEGFSVSTYKYSKLSFLSQKNSLFIEHLVRESSILYDYKNKLYQILRNHKCKLPTFEEIENSKSFLNFLKVIPTHNLGYAWFCDCFFVGLRNYLILKNAKNNNFSFSFLNQIDELRINSEISNENFKTLKELRVIKRNYREKVIDELPNKEFTSEIISLAKKLNLIKDTVYVNSVDFSDYVESCVHSTEINNYQKLRLLEIYYLINGIKSNEFDKIFNNPQFYTMKFKNNKFVEKLLMKIKTAHNKGCNQFGMNSLQSRVGTQECS